LGPPFLSIVSGISRKVSTSPAAPNASKAQERDAAAEPIAHPSRQRRTQRGSDSNSAAHDALRQIEAAGPARDVGNGERNQHAEHRGGDTVEHLHRHQQARVDDDHEQQAANG
jgi:hypothetical protein